MTYQFWIRSVSIVSLKTGKRLQNNLYIGDTLQLHISYGNKQAYNSIAVDITLC